MTQSAKCNAMSLQDRVALLLLAARGGDQEAAELGILLFAKGHRARAAVGLVFGLRQIPSPSQVDRRVEAWAARFATKHLPALEAEAERRQAARNTGGKS